MFCYNPVISAKTSRKQQQQKNSTISVLTMGETSVEWFKHGKMCKTEHYYSQLKN